MKIIRNGTRRKVALKAAFLLKQEAREMIRDAGPEDSWLGKRAAKLMGVARDLEVMAQGFVGGADGGGA